MTPKPQASPSHGSVHTFLRRYKVQIFGSSAGIPGVILVSFIIFANFILMFSISHEFRGTERGVPHETLAPRTGKHHHVGTMQQEYKMDRSSDLRPSEHFYVRINRLVHVDGEPSQNVKGETINMVQKQGQKQHRHRAVGPDYYDYHDDSTDTKTVNHVEDVSHLVLKCKAGKTLCPVEFQAWYKSMVPICGKTFIGFDRNFAYLQNVTVNRHKAIGQKGGESLEKVMNQKEIAEFYKYQMGFFEVVNCPKILKYTFSSYNGKCHAKEWIKSVSVTKNKPRSDPVMVNPNFTIAVTRYEYVNWYHSMTDFYNAFIMMKFFGKHPEETDILIMDAHPQGKLDEVWPTLFGNSKRLSETEIAVSYQQMVWNIMGYTSLMNKHVRKTLPLVEDFREFFLRRYQVPTSKTINCDKLDVLFIWRHDYVAHPRNPSGSIIRKIYNEEEILEAVRSEFPTFNIQGLQLDLLDLKNQLELIANTDILIGMHGAGLTHTLFLPKHGGLIEMFPNYSSVMGHFRSLSKWRGLHYAYWKNGDHALEHTNHRTEIPTTVINKRMHEMVTHITKKSC